MPASNFDIVAHYNQIIKNDADIAIPVAAIQSLLHFIESSNATTMSELTITLEQAANQLEQSTHGSLPLEAGCALFKRFFAITTEHLRDLSVGKQRLLDRGRQFVERAANCRQGIAQLGARFIQDGMVVLVHSYSRVVLRVLQHAYDVGTRFEVLVTEARPTCSGLLTARACKEHGIRVRMVADAATACALEQANVVLLGTEAVTENGGLVSQIGTYQIAMMAKAAGRPCYAVAESYKFVRRLPLTQNDLPSNAPTALHGSKLALDDKDQEGDGFEWLRPHVDFTPPEYVTLFVTDLGVLTPAGIGDELFRLYG